LGEAKGKEKETLKHLLSWWRHEISLPHPFSFMLGVPLCVACNGRASSNGE